MKMYAACLASYNNGHLHGRWFDLEDYADADELKQAIAVYVLRTSPYPNVTVTCPACSGKKPEQFFCRCCDKTGQVASAEEWAAHDWDGEGLATFGEYPDIQRVLNHVEMVEMHGEAWAAFTAYHGGSVTEDDFQAAYRGHYDSEKAFAEEWCCELHGLKGDESFFNWIDWQQAWDCDLSHTFVYQDGYVFHSSW